MKPELLKTTFEQNGFKVITMMFLEEGYLITLKCIGEDSDDDAMIRLEREKFDKIEKIRFEGLAYIDTEYKCGKYNLTIVPTSVDEMFDFIWKYVEKYGRKTSTLGDLLQEACGVLERVVDSIPYEQKEEREQAFKSYEKITTMVL